MEMRFLVLNIIALLNAVYSKEFIATDFGKDELVRMNDEFQPNKTYEFATADMNIDGFQARYHNDNLMLLWLNNAELVTRYMDSMSNKTLTKINFKIDVNNFDVQSCGDNLIMINRNGDLSSIFLGNLKNGSYVQIISQHPGEDIRSATIHPTKLIVYYMVCKGATFSFKIFDVEAKKELDSFVPPVCLDAIAYDETNDIMWAVDGNQIYKSNLRDRKFEMVSERDAGIISSIAVGSQDLFVMHNKVRSATVYKFKLSPNASLQLSLPSFRIKPVMGALKGAKMYILDIENASLSVYDKQFNNKEWTASIEIDKKPIVTIQGFINSDGNVELYWTYDANNGKMEMVVANKDGVVEGSRQTLEFPVPNIVDFSIYGRDTTTYIISGTKIYTCNINNSVIQQNVREVFDDKVPLTSITSSLTIFATFCTENDQGFYTISPARNYQFLKYPTFQCFQRIYFDLNNLFVSSKNGIYTGPPGLQDIEKLSDHVPDQMNLAVVDQVYFIDSLSETGTGVYTIPKTRSKFTWNSMASFPKNFVTEIKGGCEKKDANETEESSPEITTNIHQYTATESPFHTTAKNSPIESPSQTTVKNSNSNSLPSIGSPSQTKSKDSSTGSPSQTTVKNVNSSSSIYSWSINPLMCFIFYAFVSL